MSRWVPILLVVPFLFLGLILGPTGCSSGDSLPAGVDAAMLQMADCTGINVRNLAQVFDGLMDVVQAIDDPENLPPGLTWNPTTGQFSLMFDLNDDGVDDTTVAGTVTGNYDPWEINDAFTVDWGFLSGGGTEGSGLWTFTRLTATTFRMIGDTTIDGGNGCRMEVSSQNILVDVTTIETGGPTGTIGFRVVSGTRTLESGLIVFDGSGAATVTGSYEGVPIEFHIDLDTWEPYF